MKGHSVRTRSAKRHFLAGTLCLLGCAGGLHAQPGSLTVLGVTSQQALIHYTAPGTNACTLVVTDNSGLGVTVWDVNPGIFASADQDLSRANTIAWNGGLSRGVVLGKRTAEVGVDGKLYSRSLQQNTDHTVTVICDGTPLSMDFTTANPPIGATNPDPPAYNAAGFGSADWPTIDWTNQAQVYIDPHTGIALKAASWPNQDMPEQLGEQFNTYFDINGTWTNAANIISGNSGNLAGTSNTNPIFVAIPPNTIGGGQGPSWVSNSALADLRTSTATALTRVDWRSISVFPRTAGTPVYRPCNRSPCRSRRRGKFNSLLPAGPTARSAVGACSLGRLTIW